MPLFAVFMSLADPFLGRFDRTTLSQETLMELLIQGFVNRQAICGSAENQADIADWNHVELNRDGKVITINSQSMQLNGSLCVQYVPPTTEILWMGCNKLSGSLELELAPDSLKNINLTYNSFSGSLDFTRLPAQLEELTIYKNSFSGTVDLTSLPKQLKRLNAHNNRFSGNVVLNQLPERLIYLNLGSNMFCGCVDLTALPVKMARLFLHHNPSLAGETDFRNLPDSLGFLSVEGTKVSGTVVIPKETRRVVAHEGSQVEVNRE